ncbi:hypothetical protein [Plastoroseomonas hellenica]|uniref:hypothetical protein n=1 Tax=Plastoroseomonas hellenica TaxID=2687306 RepID=UPI001BAB25AD|nr:hypothetical protein [Plastoroseomonas hellenica]MBR0646078.1 hypothetical protein [Plastoroseomonas hellenica]
MRGKGAALWRTVPLLLSLPLLGACQAVPQIVGAATAITSGAFTANPAVGIAVGMTTAAATDAAIKYYGRSRQRGTQDAIAAAAGALPVGGQAPWRIEHDIPIGNERGDVHVVRNIDNPLAPCREIVFSVVDGEGAAMTRDWYAAQICRQGDRWRWASAEPTVDRWGSLH